MVTTVATAMVLVTVAMPVPVASVVATTTTAIHATATPVPPSPTTIIPRQSREDEAGAQRRIPITRNPGLDRLVAFHRAELDFRGGLALLVGGGGLRGDRPVGDLAGEGKVDGGSRDASPFGVAHLHHQRLGQPAAQYGALSVPRDGPKCGRTAGKQQVARPATGLSQNQNQKDARKPERVGSHMPPAR